MGSQVAVPALDTIVETVGDGWRASVTLDGQDVSARCVAVGFAGERPVAVLLGRGDDQAVVLTVGVITVSGLRAHEEIADVRVERSK